MGANAEEKLAPFNYAYVPYNIAIAVATAGVPLAASKFVAKYNAIGAYRVGQKLYKSSFIVMSISGIIGFLILFYLAPDIAVITLGQKRRKRWMDSTRDYLDYSYHQYSSGFYPTISNMERGIPRLSIDGSNCCI